MPDVAIAAPNEAAADAGERAALAGGNAVDAAVAAVLVTMVNEVGLVSLSSGGFVTVQPPGSGPAWTVDGWMDMPGRGLDVPPGTGTWDVHTSYGGGVDITIGPGSVAVHGALLALGEAHAREGSLPWAELVAPAVEVARGGFRLGAASRYYLEHVHDSIFGWDPVSSAAVHDPTGAVTTEPLVVPGLVDTLEALARTGPHALNSGELGRAIGADVRARGGLLGPEDLAGYRTVTRPSILHRTGPWSLSTTPSPSVGGVCVAAMLRLLDGRPRGGWDEAEVARLVEVQRAVLGHRHAHLDRAEDPEGAARDLLALLADGGELPGSGSTAHVSTADSDGRACAVTVSSGYFSGMVAAGTGVWLNNSLGEQELNARGLHAAPPGTRLQSNMAPTVARHDDGSVLAVGSPGASRISTAVVQVLAGYVGGMSLEEAVRHPRVHVHRAGTPEEEVQVETVLSMYFGGVGVALAHPDGRLLAAADPRREGAVRTVTGGAAARG
ncbi:gamma-glutamyltransferase [Nocardioides solisilvae]|uniref:gamma-glutamyltransferase n=1 Tax=Nocardioides solisilvae TaxID=1542435 RepID=UPI000D74404C|nr:gamma-glutamyltransferase [Nocardioides solisilvae]